jgi:hypothetical protein
MTRVTAILAGLAVILSAGASHADILDCVGVTWTKEGTIQDVQLGIDILPYDRVKLTNQVVVTGLMFDGFFVQEVQPIGTAFSGVFVYTGGAPTSWAVGDLVEVIGEAYDYYGLTEIRIYNNLGCAKIVGSASVPAPVPLTTCDLNDSTNTEAEKWEGVLVSIDSVRVTRTNDGTNRWWQVEEIDSDANCAANDSLWIGKKSYAPYAVPDSLDTLCTIVGHGDFAWYVYRIQPRGNNDIIYCGLPPAPETRYAYPIDDTHLAVEFDRALDRASAENANNYYITGFDIDILSSAMMADSFGVVLTTSDMSFFRDTLTARTLTVQNVANSDGVPMTSPNTEQFIPGVKSVAFMRTVADSASLAGRPVCIGAVATAAPTESYLNRHMFIQDRTGFGYGLDCYVGNVPDMGTYGIERGDSVLISGLAGPYFGNLQMGSIIDTVLIAAKKVGVIAPVTVSLATALTEPYEGKLVRIEGLKVFSDSIGWGEFSLWQGGADTISVDDIFEPGIKPFHPGMNGLYDPQVGDSVQYVQGLLNYDYGRRKINPRDIDDICSSRLTDVEGGVPGYANQLLANRPNPFNPTTTIEFSIERTGRVDLKVYDTAGREVRTLKSGTAAAGPHSVLWDGTSNSGEPVASGVYFYSLKASEFSSTKKMVLIR